MDDKRMEGEAQDGGHRPRQPCLRRVRARTTPG
jgi:hypothetical protein